MNAMCLTPRLPLELHWMVMSNILNLGRPVEETDLCAYISNQDVRDFPSVLDPSLPFRSALSRLFIEANVILISDYRLQRETKLTHEDAVQKFITGLQSYIDREQLGFDFLTSVRNCRIHLEREASETNFDGICFLRTCPRLTGLEIRVRSLSWRRFRTAQTYEAEANKTMPPRFDASGLQTIEFMNNSCRPQRSAEVMQAIIEDDRVWAKFFRSWLTAAGFVGWLEITTRYQYYDNLSPQPYPLLRLPPGYDHRIVMPNHRTGATNMTRSLERYDPVYERSI